MISCRFEISMLFDPIDSAARFQKIMMHLMNGQPPAIANRQYKSTIFAMLFQEKKRISIPHPRFLVFYNGRQKMPDRMTVKLSELYHKEGSS